MDTQQQKDPTFEGWAFLELMGHRKLAGFVREQNFAGAGLIRIDVPGDDGNVATQFYSPSALYCLTPTTEEMARRASALRLHVIRHSARPAFGRCQPASREHALGRLLGGRLARADRGPGLQVLDSVNDTATDLAIDRTGAIGSMLLQGPD